MYEETSRSIKKRVADLLSQMTLAEKVSQMVYDAPAIERLGIPAYNWWNECLHGVGRAGVATVFPQAIGLAATWNDGLIHRIAVAISDEARAKHHEALRRGVRAIYAGLTAWTPNVNIFRDPRWGRGQETYGEDPYLTSAMGVAFVKGLQGDDPNYLKLAATPKHYAVHSGPELDRHHFDAQVQERDLRETYLPAFEACVVEGKAASVMGAYNRVHGEPCCASPRLLAQILRGEWGFDGYVVSDCGAIDDIYLHHRVVETAEEAAALAVRAGCDLNCGNTYPALLDAVEQGLIAEEVIDRAVERLLAARFRLGMFDPPDQVPYAQHPYHVVDSEEHRALALQVARESIVLLENEGNLLPLPTNLDAVAVVGPNADDAAALLGNYNGTPARLVTPLEGIRRKLGPATPIYYAPGCSWADGVSLLEVIPTTYLRPGDADTTNAGLKGEYYDNCDFRGEPRLSRVDTTVDLIWKGTTPLSGQWADPFAVRWTGFLVPPQSGTYEIGVSGHSGYRLYLDGNLLCESDSIHHPICKTQAVTLEAGRFYRLQLDYVSRGLDPQVQLLWAMPGRDYESEALEVARKASVVVAVMGLSPRLEGEEMPVQVDGFRGGDRTTIDLPGSQARLLEQLYALGKPLVLVLLNGGALAVHRAAGQAAAAGHAIVEAWYPGQAGGEALADVLFGDYNPGGRLPVTFYRSPDDLPEFDDYAMEGRTYRYFQGEPLYPFGYGLSYTTFAYHDLRLDRLEVPVGGQVTVGVSVTNTGNQAGDEVVQLYVRQPEVAAARPIQELKGFARISLEPGECKRVSFALHSHQLGTYDQSLHYTVQPGTVEVLVGRSAADLLLAGRFQIVGQPAEAGSDRVYFSQVQVTTQA